MRYIHTILMVLFLSVSIIAQDSGNKSKREKQQDKIESRIESQKIAFITQKLELSPKEAQQFWPIYNEYHSKMKEMRSQNKKNWEDTDFSEAEANDLLDGLLSREQDELDIKKQYLTKLKTVVPARKVAQLYIIEKEFREEILSRIRSKIGQKKRNSRRGNNGF